MDKGNLRDEIARVAYDLYEKRGRTEGCSVDDWLEAERIVISRAASQADTGSKVEAAKAVRRRASAAPKPKNETEPAPSRKSASSEVKKPAVRKKK